MAKNPKTATTPTDLRQQILHDLRTLRLPLTAEQLDAVLSRADKERLTHLEFLHQVLAVPANGRRERSIARRVREAKFRDLQSLDTFDWNFNAKVINRLQIEELATGDFIRRRENIVVVGQSGVGKSHIFQALGLAACGHLYKVRYITSADLLKDLTAALADQSLSKRLRYYIGFELLIIDEFGLDRLERQAAPQAASLLYKIIDGRVQKRSTALITNLDFEGWPEYLGDAPLVMAFMDRLVDGAIILKMKGKSYRAYRAQQKAQSATTATRPATLPPLNPVP